MTRDVEWQRIEDAIAEYRAELLARAELAASDLDELEDHMRAVIDEVLASGAAIGDAIGEARCRLGDPASVAREHARVRSPFGATIHACARGAQPQSLARSW